MKKEEEMSKPIPSMGSQTDSCEPEVCRSTKVTQNSDKKQFSLFSLAKEFGMRVCASITADAIMDVLDNLNT